MFTGSNVVLNACAAFLTCVLAGGCTSYGVYSDSWPEKASVESGQCPDIDGEYVSQGETINETDGQQYPGQPVELIAVLSEGIDYSIPGAEYLEKVGVQVVDETLRVTATLNGGGELRFERPALDCRDSMLVMGTDWKHSIQEEGGAEALGMTMGMFHWFERTSWKLARAEDGSLLMRKSEGGSLMLYWFPVLPGWETTWIRFPRFIPTLEAEAAAYPPAFRPVLREEMSIGGR